MLISKYGPPLLCLKTIVYNGVKQITSASRSVTNKISTTISNVCHDKRWNYNLVHPNDGIRYEHGCLKINSFRITEISGDKDESCGLDDRMQSLNSDFKYYIPSGE
eukprot:6577630-Ditylum_brightwellii.AAC.1